MQEVKEKGWTPQGEYYDRLTHIFGKASDCVACGQCEKACPQHLSIIEDLKKVAEYFGISQQHHHRALDDALTAARVYQRLWEEFGEQQAALFAPSPLCFHVKKESAITNSQKGYLRDLLKYHRIESNVKIDTLTKSEASRMIDGIILQYGKIIRR